MTFVDISTRTARKTAVKRGDFNLATTTQMIFQKKSGASTAIRRGYCLARVDDVTPSAFEVTTGKASKTVVIGGMPWYPNANNTNVTNAVDGNGEDIAAEDGDIAFQGIIRSEDVVVKAGGAIQPGQRVMTAADGEVVAYDGSGEQYVIGFYKAKVGGESDGAYLKQECADHDLISINFNGGI